MASPEAAGAACLGVGPGRPGTGGTGRRERRVRPRRGGQRFGHPLLVPGLVGAWAYDAAWGTDDHAQADGMEPACRPDPLRRPRAAYGRRTARGADAVVRAADEAPSAAWLPPTTPPSYGVVTQVPSRWSRPNGPRSCAASASPSRRPTSPPSRPSTWSGALDQIAAGAMPGDSADGVPASRAPKRLVVVATGNVEGDAGGRHEVAATRSRPELECTDYWRLHAQGVVAVAADAARRGRQPPSLDRRGSQSLPDDLTPIKPEVLFEAGNMLSDAAGWCGWHEAVSLLAPGADVGTEPLVPRATSAAAGVAANFLGRLQAALPDHWPETHRALTVDSAAWPQSIRKQLIGRGAHWKAGTARTRSKEFCVRWATVFLISDGPSSPRATT